MKSLNIFGLLFMCLFCCGRQPTGFGHLATYVSPKVSEVNFADRADTNNRFRRQIQRKDPRMVYITFINKSGRRVRVLQSDYFGFAVPKFDLRPNEPVTYFQYPGSSWMVQDAETGRELLLNGKEVFHVGWKYRGKTIDIRIKMPDGFRDFHSSPRKAAKIGTVFLEVLVIADSTLVRHYGKENVEEYVLALFGIVSKIFTDKSLGIPVHIAVVNVYLSEKDPKFYKLKENNAEISARSACQFVQNVKYKIETTFDIGVVLTRKYIGPSGYAAMYTMCTSRSCALARENGFSSAYVIAHEIGHALGLEHDGEGEECVVDKTEGSIMAPKVYSKHDKYHWSKCSKKAFSENVRYFRCLKNRPHSVHRNFNKVSSLLPGELFPPDKQCKIYHGQRATACSKFAYRVCNYLWCRKRPWNECTPMFWTAPVDGSPCFSNRWCVRGRCVSRSKPEPIHGNWGQWSGFKACHGLCDIGIQRRERRCDNPKPENSGKPCRGKDHEIRTCILQQCSGENKMYSAKSGVCRDIGRDWNSVNRRKLDSIIERQGIRCTFEEGFCGWRSEQNAKMKWVRHNAETSSAGTGPSADHTLKNDQGHYIYVEASWIVSHIPFKKGDKSALVSKEINFKESCFSFYYHMLGDDDCELLLFLKIGFTEKKMWRKVGSQGTEWKKAMVHIKSNQPFKLKFVTIRGSSYKGDIALDDINIFYGSCTGTQSPCEIICHSPLTNRVIVKDSPDGLPCYNNMSNDLCYQKECMKIGCDKKLDSGKVIDECGVCGGNGKTCNWYKGTKSLQVTEGKQNVLDVPVGTRNIVIRHRSNPETFLGLLATISSVPVGFNHDDDRWPPGDYNILGTTFRYSRNGSVEEIRSIGPLKNRVNIILFSPKRTGQDRNPSTEKVVFRMRLASQPRSEYRWLHTGWNACSSSCTEGYQTPIISCVDALDKAVLDIFCEHLEKPAKNRLCVSKECSARYLWVALNWTQCSTTCGHGFQARKVMCLRRGRSFVSSHYCRDQPPSKVRQCYSGPCPSYSLMPGPWDPCSKECNGGTQSRRIYCVNLRDSKITDSLLLCGGEFPVSRRPCNIASCDWKKKKAAKIAE